MHKSKSNIKQQSRRRQQRQQTHRNPQQAQFFPDNTLKRTIGHMQDYIKGLKSRDNAAEMEFLKNLLSQYNITIVPEFFRTTDTSTQNAHLDFINNVNSSSFLYLRNAKLGRVLLYSDRNNVDFNHPISFECNGVILDTETWKPLVIPSAAFNTAPNYKSITQNMHNYKIYPIFDGTLVNFYYYNNNNNPVWCMGSKHGYDVAGYKWIGDKTYLEAFKSALGTVAYEDFIAALSPDACYSVLFRCHEFHPLLNDPQQVQLVRIADLNTMEEVAHDDPRYLKITALISEQKPYEDGLLFCDLYHLIANTQPKEPQTKELQSKEPQPKELQPKDTTQQENAEVQYAISKEKLKSLISRNQTALESYLRSVPAPKKGKDATTFKTHAPHIHYGYILRDSRWHSVSHVMLESTLLKQVRQYIYNLPNAKHTTQPQPKITESNRLNYSILRAYLSSFGQKEQFLRLFPQFIPTYGYYDDIMTKITKRVIKQFKGHTGARIPKLDKTANANTNTENETTDGKKIEVISRELYKHISSREKINPFDKNSVSLIRNYIEHPGNINFLFVALHGQ